MGKSQASGRWEGGLKTGHGAMKPGHAAEVPFGAGTRFEGEPGSNPEELIGAALAGCFSMALAAALEKEGAQPVDIETHASVQLERRDGGFAIGSIALDSRATVRGIDAGRFQRLAQETKSGCPVGKALSNVPITLQATLTSSGEQPGAGAPL